MGTEHRFRGDRRVDHDAFDWMPPAEELEIPLDAARALYDEALRRAMYPGSRPAKDLYLEWLAAWEPEEPLADPGRRTATMRIGQPRRREPTRRARVPGKRPLTADLSEPRPLPAEARDEARRLEHREARPSREAIARGYDFFLGRGGGEPGLAQGDEGLAHEPADVAPGAPGWSWTVLEGGSQGLPLPGEIAARLGPHVGHEAAGAARLHTDDTAELVAAAHRARAVAIGDQIYFARGEYAPGTERGDELLAHELTHVAQARRGELVHAAAKGIDSGNTLDPAEAEAELRAKLAVIQLHAPDAAAAAPELAAPSGQPTSDSERAAKLAAQQQRLDLVGADVLPDAAETVVPDEIPQAPVAHPAPEMTAAPAPAAASSGNAYVATFDATPSQQATELWAQAGTEATTEATAETAELEAGLEPLPVVLDGAEVPDAAGDGQAEHAPELATEQGAVPPATELAPTPEPQPMTAATDAAEAVTPTSTIEQLMAAVMGAFAAFPTTLPEDVPVEPGPAPVTDLAGQADPARALGDHQQAVGEGAAALETERESLLTGPGAAQVQPIQLDEQLEVPALEAGEPMPELPTIEGMTKLQQWSLPAEVQASFDEVAKPKMEASLAEAKVKMTEAQTQRDVERTRAVDDAHEKVKLAHEDADKQQQAKVAETRSQITNHQAQTLLKQENEAKSLELQSGEKKKATVGSIQERLQADQAQIETDYADARTRADDEKRAGEEEVARTQQDAEDEANRDPSWWEQAADAICSAVQAIADEINAALEALGAAIGAILDAVKEAACQLIDAACEFVCQALTEFGDWLKDAVTTLIGSVFPELAAELNRLIDEAVTAATEAVTALADQLKEAVTALCDGLKAAIDAAIAVFQAAVQAAATLVQALVTGDWSLVAQMVLDGILQALGIDPAAFYALIGSAQDSLEKIVEDPGAFVGHLIDAVKLGFEQFGTNFWTHLQAGVVEWLFGTFAEAGIQMPAQFDLAGIFDLVMQVLGLTWDRLRVKVVDLIGEENTQRLELVAGYIEALITGGLGGLWEQVQQDLSNLWDMVIGGIQDWLIENVVQQAILKIATMWNPVGAIIQLIQTAWGMYQWLAENAQRIFGLVQAVVDSIANIVAGDISGAANWIEQSLADLVPVAISLFANLLGLGGLADHIRTVIEDVQQAVDEAIDALIARVMAMFRGDDGDEEAGEATEEPAVPTSLVEPSPVMVDHVPPELDSAIEEASSGTVIYQAGTTDPEEVTRNLLATHPDAHLDPESGCLTLPPLSENVLEQVSTLQELGQKITEETGVSKVTLTRSGTSVLLRGHINPPADVVEIQPPDIRRAVYEALALVRGELQTERSADLDPAHADSDEMPVQFNRALQGAYNAYDGACQARLPHTLLDNTLIDTLAFSGNVFSFCDNKYFVDQDNNYVIPEDSVGARIAKNGTEVWAADRQLPGQYRYATADMSTGDMRSVAQMAVRGKRCQPVEGAMFLAIMCAEARRNPIADVTNMILLNDHDPERNDMIVEAPMARGGSDDAGAARDQDLQGICQLPPADISHREIAVVTARFLCEEGAETMAEYIAYEWPGAIPANALSDKIADFLRAAVRVTWM